MKFVLSSSVLFALATAAPSCQKYTWCGTTFPRIQVTDYLGQTVTNFDNDNFWDSAQKCHDACVAQFGDCDQIEWWSGVESLSTAGDWSSCFKALDGCVLTPYTDANDLTHPPHVCTDNNGGGGMGDPHFKVRDRMSVLSWLKREIDNSS